MNADTAGNQMWKLQIRAQINQKGHSSKNVRYEKSNDIFSRNDTVRDRTCNMKTMSLHIANHKVINPSLSGNTEGISVFVNSSNKS